MFHTLFERAGSLQVGTVETVSPDRIEVILIGEAPESVALNASVPRPFPRVHDYLLIPVDDSFLVGQVEWIRIDREPFPTSRALQNTGLVELPYPRRQLKLNPLGTLRAGTTDGQYLFQRGADALPSVGAAVMLPDICQLRSVVELGSDQGRITIGTTPLAGHAEVRVDPNRLFGRHLAVLGNTGSGKSCSVAGLIRWSLEQAQSRYRSGRPNARFIVLDPNGEYTQAFSDGGIAQARIFAVDSDNAENALKVPLWFWNSAEWCSVTRASPGIQRPLLIRALREAKAIRTEYADATDEDIPLPFSGKDLEERVEDLAGPKGKFQYQNMEPLITRIRTLLANPRLVAIIDDTEDVTLQQWLQNYIGKNDAEDGCVSVIDLSLVPSEVIQIVTAVIARLIFDAHQRYVNQEKDSLPTVLVMEEAHTFIKRYREDTEYQDAATVCCQAFERIAREGRKFGLGLVLSSQRPHEISPTVLSQCNTFLLHRLSNDRDQEIVRNLVPENLRGLMRELPMLLSQTAILLGWAAELPVLVRMNDLKQEQQPRSEDPEFWKVWTAEKDRTIDWNAIVNVWQGRRQDNEGRIGAVEEDIPF